MRPLCSHFNQIFAPADILAPPTFMHGPKSTQQCTLSPPRTGRGTPARRKLRSRRRSPASRRQATYPSAARTPSSGIHASESSRFFVILTRAHPLTYVHVTCTYHGQPHQRHHWRLARLEGSPCRPIDGGYALTSRACCSVPSRAPHTADHRIVDRPHSVDGAECGLRRSTIRWSTDGLRR